MGLMDCVAATKEDYVEKAVRLAKDRDYRESIKKKILAAKDVLFENRGAVLDLEQFFLKAAPSF
jgi:predicted O-linked N-acetylglucosamine transferase (SPINDLY family)